MTDRILDISDRPAFLSVRNALLVVRFAEGHGSSCAEKDEPQDCTASSAAGVAVPAISSSSDGGVGAAAAQPPREDDAPYVHRAKRHDEVTVPLTDIAALIVSHPQVSFTHAVLAGLAEAGAIFVACNPKHMPAAMLLPLASHSTQTERFAQQAALSQPARKQMWQQIVRAKILAQARLVEERAGRDFGLLPMASRVRSGDAGNLESQAARIYWPALFGDFHRDPEGEGVNACLNYGYAVLRAVVARALCGAGLHPSLGVHHHNRYDAFCLADDLMEPFRPLVDRVVAGLHDQRGPSLAVDKDSKAAIIQGLLQRYVGESESRTLFDWAARAASSLAAVIEGREEKLAIPELTPGT
jgi:CRISPR-associated protein Cas1